MKDRTPRQASLLFLTMACLSWGCGESTNPREERDPDFRQVRIGNQVWMAENLDLDMGEGSYCYGDEEANCKTMGRLYTWEAAVIAGGEVEGWRLPSQADWEILLSTLGFDGSPGSDSLAFRALVAEETGFDPVWAGVRVPSGRYQAGGMDVANFWSSSPLPDDSTAWSVGVMGNLGIVSPHNYPRASACTVRLIQEADSGPPGG